MCLTLATPWTAAHQASQSFTISQSLLKLMSIESAMPCNHARMISIQSPPSSLALSLSQHQGLFQLVSSFHQVPKDFPQWLHWWTFLPAVHKGSPFSRFSPIVIYCLFDDTVILIGVKRYLTVVCILLFLMIGNIEHLMYMLAICLLWKNIYSYPLPVF